jgi:hypothetical protein
VKKILLVDHSGRGLIASRWCRDPGAIMRRVLLLVAVIGLTFGAWVMTATSVHGCMPAPWTFDDLVKGTKAVVYGKVISTSEGGRRARLTVMSYAGPGQAPATVELPPTRDSRTPSGENVCPDFSTRFEEGMAYVVLLADIPPNLQLAHPTWITALRVGEDGHATVNMKGDRQPVGSLLESFAHTRGYRVASPGAGAPNWRSRRQVWPWVIGGFASLAALWVLLKRGMWRRHA